MKIISEASCDNQCSLPANKHNTDSWKLKLQLKSDLVIKDPLKARSISCFSPQKTTWAF